MRQESSAYNPSRCTFCVKTPFAAGVNLAGDARGRGGLRHATVAEEKLRRIGGVETRIVRIKQQRFRIARERPAQHRLMNKIHSESRRMAARSVRHVVAELIFLLIAQHRKRGDGRDELIVAESLETGNGAGASS